MDFYESDLPQGETNNMTKVQSITKEWCVSYLEFDTARADYEKQYRPS